MCYSCPIVEVCRMPAEEKQQAGCSRARSSQGHGRGPGERSVEGCVVCAHGARLGIKTLDVGLPRPQRSGEQRVGSLSMPRTLDFRSCRECCVYRYPALREDQGYGASCIKTASRRHKHARERPASTLTAIACKNAFGSVGRPSEQRYG